MTQESIRATRNASRARAQILQNRHNQKGFASGRRVVKEQIRKQRRREGKWEIEAQLSVRAA